jgi:hypothetical protein
MLLFQKISSAHYLSKRPDSRLCHLGSDIFRHMEQELNDMLTLALERSNQDRVLGCDPWRATQPTLSGWVGGVGASKVAFPEHAATDCH